MKQSYQTTSLANTTIFLWGNRTEEYDGITVSEWILRVFLQVDIQIGFLLSLSTMILNTISLIVVSGKHTSSRISVNLKLVKSLCVSDFLIGLFIFMHLMHILLRPLMNPSRDSRDPNDALVVACTWTVTFALFYTAILASNLTVISMGIDHYLSIVKPLHYHDVMRKWSKPLIYIIWSTAVSGGFSNLIIGAFGFSSNYTETINYCEFVTIKIWWYDVEYLSWSVAFISMVILTFTYITIFRKVYELNQTNTSFSRANVRNKKAMRIFLIIVGTFMITWIPTLILNITMLNVFHFNKVIARRYIKTIGRLTRYFNYLLLLNALIDPIVYVIYLHKRNYFHWFCCCCNRLLRCYSDRTRPTSRESIPESSSYVYYRQKNVQISAQMAVKSPAALNQSTKLTDQFQTPIRVTFTKSKSYRYNHQMPNDLHTMYVVDIDSKKRLKLRVPLQEQKTLFQNIKSRKKIQIAILADDKMLKRNKHKLTDEWHHKLNNLDKNENYVCFNVVESKV